MHVFTSYNPPKKIVTPFHPNETTPFVQTNNFDLLLQKINSLNFLIFYSPRCCWGCESTALIFLLTNNIEGGRKEREGKKKKRFQIVNNWRMFLFDPRNPPRKFCVVSLPHGVRLFNGHS